jgi:hypothetical protein
MILNPFGYMQICIYKKIQIIYMKLKVEIILNESTLNSDNLFLENR